MKSEVNKLRKNEKGMTCRKTLFPLKVLNKDMQVEATLENRLLPPASFRVRNSNPYPCVSLKNLTGVYGSLVLFLQFTRFSFLSKWLIVLVFYNPLQERFFAHRLILSPSVSLVFLPLRKWLLDTKTVEDSLFSTSNPSLFTRDWQWQQHQEREKNPAERL